MLLALLTASVLSVKFVKVQRRQKYPMTLFSRITITDTRPTAVVIDVE